ncbi:MAG: FtsX-like permease family protein, partial [Chloroflexota bacterium]|nr:FtsX-like permease family protein [Chloroflexota bacterium]
LIVSLGDNPNASADAAPTTAATGETNGETAATSQAQLEQLMAGGLTSVLTVLQGGLPGISTARYEQLRAEAAQEPLIDAVASSILFPTIIRNVSTGQGEPLGVVFAVDEDYDSQFGLTDVAGEPVQMESLQPGVGNIFAQASSLFSLAQSAGQGLLGENFSISDAALATAAVGAALTAGAAGGAGGAGVDLADISIPITTVRNLGIDTTLLEPLGITQSLSLAALGITSSTLGALGVNTTTVSLNSVGIDTSGLQTVTTNLLGALNLNTLGTEIDRVLAQFGLQLRQGDVYLSQMGAQRLDARVGDVLEIYVGPIPIPFRVKAIVAEAGPLGAVLPVVMMRLEEAQQLFFMGGKVNNVLVSNQGDDLGGLVHTEAVSQRLRMLAMDEATLTNVVSILRRPAVTDAITEAAARYEDEFFGPGESLPPMIASLIQSITPIGGIIEEVQAFPALLGEPGLSENLRATLAQSTIRSWLLDEAKLPRAVQAELQAVFGNLNQFDVLDPLSKSTVVTVAQAGGGVFSSVFSLFGIFSILAGVMLIFLIFVMLAAERRSEMGMARAIGVQRRQLVQMFVTEGVLYDLAAAALGVALGLGISYLMVGFIGGVFNNVSSQLGVAGATLRFYFHVQPSSIIIAYCLGVLLTFIVVTVASWRVSRLNIVSAIRGLPEEANARTRSTLNKIWRWTLGPLLVAGGVYLFYVTWG